MQQLTNDVSHAMDNLATATIFKNETVEQLVKSNYELAWTIPALTKDNEKLLHIIENLTGGTPKPQNKTNIDPYAYCLTHGYHVGQGHTSKTWTSHAPGLKEDAMKANNLGGSQANKLKTVKWKGEREQNVNQANTVTSTLPLDVSPLNIKTTPPFLILPFSFGY